jgi:hypothetical protein
MSGATVAAHKVELAGYDTSPGHVRGRAAIEKRYGGQGGPLSLRALAHSTEGSTGIIIGAFARQKGEADIGKFTLTLRKAADGRRLIMSDRTTGTRGRKCELMQRPRRVSAGDEIPLARYPNTYNGQPLCYAALAAQKNHNALYLTDVYQDPSQAKRLRDGFRKAGKKLDMGKSCLRLQKTEDLELEVIGEIISRTPPKGFIARYEAGRRGRSSGSTRTAE